MLIKNRLARLEHAVYPPRENEQRTEILVNVSPPCPDPSAEHPRGADGIPKLSDAEIADIKAGGTTCFIFSEPPRHVSFRPDGRGGIDVRTGG